MYGCSRDNKLYVLNHSARNSDKAFFVYSCKSSECVPWQLLSV